MNYSEMSDFEINKAVGEIVLDGKWACKPGSSGNPTESWYYGSKDTFADPLPQLPDYCHSWAAAGPIIAEHAIGIMPFKKSPAEAWPLSVGLLSNASVKHQNPLRAAMIVFLMMQEAKNA